MPKRKSTKDRILDKIAAHNGVTSPGLLASDLRLSIETIKKHVRTLLSEGRVSRVGRTSLGNLYLGSPSKERRPRS